MDYDMRLINEVMRYPELYDNMHKDFKNKEVKQAIWCNIAFKLRKECDEQSVKVVRMRWKSLRDSYVKETKHKMALSSGQDVKPRKEWRYSGAMSFLAPHLAISFPMPRKLLQVKNEDMKEDYDDAPYYGEVNSSQDSNAHANEHFLGALLDYSMKSCQTPAASSVAATTGAIKEQENEVDAFFKGLAETVKKMHPINQIKIQRDIVNMVLGYRLKELQENFRPGEV